MRSESSGCPSHWQMPGAWLGFDPFSPFIRHIEQLKLD